MTNGGDQVGHQVPRMRGIRKKRIFVGVRRAMFCECFREFDDVSKVIDFCFFLGGEERFRPGRRGGCLIEKASAGWRGCWMGVEVPAHSDVTGVHVTHRTIKTTSG